MGIAPYKFYRNSPKQSLLPACLGASPRILLAVVGHDPFTNRRKYCVCCPETGNKQKNNLKKAKIAAQALPLHGGARGGGYAPSHEMRTHAQRCVAPKRATREKIFENFFSISLPLRGRWLPEGQTERAAMESTPCHDGRPHGVAPTIPMVALGLIVGRDAHIPPRLPIHFRMLTAA